MRFALMTEPQQGLSYDEILALARTAEEAGFEAFFRSDHYASFPGEAGQPTTDAWATLAGLARETSRIGLGSLVSPVTFRLPGNFAKVVTTVAEMSGGRVEVGLGAGWNEVEHRQHGLAFPPTGSASTCSRSSWPSCTACGPSPTAGATTGATGRSRDAMLLPQASGAPGAGIRT
jgi:alkanesulfonate monooxygenase SsuD/methylene tetrahydromethanopterin reductase-like flavin-dependent oxidoreductase (luciferase family)